MENAKEFNLLFTHPHTAYNISLVGHTYENTKLVFNVSVISVIISLVLMKLTYFSDIHTGLYVLILSNFTKVQQKLGNFQSFIYVHVHKMYVTENVQQYNSQLVLT